VRVSAPAPIELYTNAKKLISPERNHLYGQIIEATECLKNWWDCGLIVQQPHAQEDDDSDACDLEKDDCGLEVAPARLLRRRREVFVFYPFHI
jgi:hypothetical protein